MIYHADVTDNQLSSSVENSTIMSQFIDEQLQ